LGGLAGSTKSSGGLGGLAGFTKSSKRSTETVPSVHAEQYAEDEGANGKGHAERLEVAFQFGVVGVRFGFHDV
jgi:hypothetical protein